MGGFTPCLFDPVCAVYVKPYVCSCSVIKGDESQGTPVLGLFAWARKEAEDEPRGWASEKAVHLMSPFSSLVPLALLWTLALLTDCF